MQSSNSLILAAFLLNLCVVCIIHLVSEWGDIIDEMSDRMANQPSLIRKFAKER